MKFRLHGRVAAAVLAGFLTLAPTAAFAAPASPGPRDARERIIQVLKQLRDRLVPSVLIDGVIPPKP